MQKQVTYEDVMFRDRTTVLPLIIIIIILLLSNCLRPLPAVCFKNAKQYEQAKDAYLKEAEYHTENKTYPIMWPV